VTLPPRVVVFRGVSSQEAEIVEGYGGEEVGNVDDGDDELSIGVEVAGFGDDPNKTKPSMFHGVVVPAESAVQRQSQ